MAPATHVALIRGINVGGNNIVPMAQLRTALQEAGATEVRTYIQSGNVVLAMPGAAAADVNAAVEAVLADSFGVNTVVVTIEAAALRDVVAQAPAGFGQEESDFKFDVVFLRPGLEVAELAPRIRAREGVDQVWPGPGALYFRRKNAQITKSYMSKIVAMPEYKGMTIRNWRTTTRLAQMLDEA